MVMIYDSGKSKGQIFTPDFMAALVVFGALLIVFLNSWDSVIEHQTASGEERLYVEGQQTMAFMVSTPGYPEDWVNEEVQVPGFAQQNNILDERKLEEFEELEYEQKTRLLRAPDFRMEVLDDGEPVYEYGREPSGAEEVIPFTRTVKINQTGNLRDAELRYIVWR